MGLVFSSVSEMMAYVQRACDGSIEFVGKDVEVILENNVARSGAVDTGKLIGSIVSEGGGDSVTIKFADGAGHTSLWGSSKLGIDVGDSVYIANWVEEGSTGTRDAANFMENTKAELESGKKHVHAMQDGLAAYGIKATIG